MKGITDFWSRLMENLPDVVVALLVLILAFVIAWLAKKLIIKLMKWLGIERLLAKSGVESKHIEQSKNFIAKLVQLVVFVLFLPGIFEKLGLNNVATPIVSMMNGMMVYLPNIVAAILVLVIGLFIAKIVKELLYPIIGKLKLNSWLEKIGVKFGKIDIADIIATTLYIVVVVLFAVEALNTLQLNVLTNIGNAIIAYLPYALSALLVILVALIFAQVVENAIVTKFNGSKGLAMVAKVAIIVIGVFMMMDQLHIASTTVNAAFIIVLGAVAVAFAISFGIGGKEFAARTLQKLEHKISNHKNSNK